MIDTQTLLIALVVGLLAILAMRDELRRDQE
jgi:hypothetical protein